MPVWFQILIAVWGATLLVFLIHQHIVWWSLPKEERKRIWDERDPY